MESSRSHFKHFKLFHHIMFDCMYFTDEVEDPMQPEHLKFEAAFEFMVKLHANKLIEDPLPIVVFSYCPVQNGSSVAVILWFHVRCLCCP